MADVNKDTVKTLNTLIETCKDGEQGFRQAAEAVKDSSTKTLFNQYARQRSEFAAELQPEVGRLGGSPETSGSTSGSAHRGWMNIKSAVKGSSDAAIIAEAERGEDVAKNAYEDALKTNLPPSVQSVVQRQYSQVKSAHDRVRELEKFSERG